MDFKADVIERSRAVPVVVDFWAPWCGPCRQLTPVLEKAVEARAGKVELVKVNTDENQEISQMFGIQGIPAVKAFKDGKVIAEFVGAQPPAAVERFMDGFVPSEAQELVASGDEESLRRALELDPRNREAAVALAKILHSRGAVDEALSLAEAAAGDFEADGLAARIRLEREGVTEPFELLDAGDVDAALEALLAKVPEADGLKDEYRQAIVGILSTFEPGDPRARDFRRRLGAALY
jgi:putative thioredoxin